LDALLTLGSTSFRSGGAVLERGMNRKIFEQKGERIHSKWRVWLAGQKMGISLGKRLRRDFM
jgi:hypothetical protein